MFDLAKYVQYLPLISDLITLIHKLLASNDQVLKSNADLSKQIAEANRDDNNQA